VTANCIRRRERRSRARERIVDYPTPRGREARTSLAQESLSFSDGCGAKSLSGLRVGEHGITSLNGSSSPRRCNPPVPHSRRFSATVQSNGLRKMPQGSQHDLGITVTSGNSSSAPLGRSPPRSVWTRRDYFALFSKPDSISAWKVVVESRGFEAIKTWPPGTRAFSSP